MFNLIKIYFFLFLAFSANNLAAQGKMEFAKTNHDFGLFREESGPVEVLFEFKNTGNQPITLSNVKASCGCTTPSWTKEEVAPGKTGLVKAAYDPTNRPGKFNKTITLESNGEPKTLLLTIQGEVVPRPKGISDWFPIESGNIRFKTKNIYFQNVLHDGVATESTYIYNQGNKAINLKTAEIRTSKHISFKTSSTVINPKDSVKLEFIFDATKISDWGYVSEQFDLTTDDEKDAAKRMHISANIRENFGKITNDSKLPQIRYDKTKHDFGKIKQNTLNSVSFTLTNDGQAPLIIRKTKASCGCTASQPKKTTLAPGETTVIEVIFNTAGKAPGKQNQNVMVITNDPARAQTQLFIEAEVVAAESIGGGK